MPLKLLDRVRHRRIWLALAAVILGVASGAVVGRETILRVVHMRLGQFAQRVLERDEEIADETRRTLAQANASPYPPCSDPDVLLLRRLTFAARFLKDVARLKDGYFLCSATSGKLTAALPLAKPDMVLSSGATIYKSLPLFLVGGDPGEVVTAGNADAVISPEAFSDFPHRRMHFVAGVPDGFTNGARGLAIADQRSRSTRVSGSLGSADIPQGILATSRTVTVAGTLYRARCSERFPVCAVSSISMTDVWQANRALMSGYLGAGGVAGLSCAWAILVAGRKRRSHSNQLKRAILNGKLSVAYQPIVELGTHRIVGAEALARWTDEDGESIRPETIIALAEAEGFVSEITRFVLTRALSEIGAILDWHPHFRLSFNLAPSDLADPRLLLLLDESLHASRIAPANVTFELPERATADREVAIAAIRRLRDRGHSVFIDDFGTGYSNLPYLTELCVDGIKINRSFIATIGTDAVSATIVPQILGVARALGLKVVVQGIEREEQAHYFATGDPRILGQGWFFGLPIPAKTLTLLCAEKTE